MNEKTYVLHFRLLKEACPIEEAINVKDLLVRDWPGIEGAKLYSGRLYHKKPKWVDFIQHVETDTIRLTNAGSGAVIFVPLTGRVMAVCFGYIHIALDLDKFERSFGLRVTLNQVARQHLRSLDTASPDSMTMQRRIQASRDSDFTVFGVDVDRDILRLAAGTPTNQSFAKFLAGQDSLTVTAKIDPETLLAKCEEALEIYQSKDYLQNGFGFIDKIKRIVDKEIIEPLDQLILTELATLRSGGDSDLHLAPPEIVNYTDGSKLHYVGYGSHGKDFYQLNIQEYADELERCGFSGTMEDIKKDHRVHAASPGSDEMKEKWKIYDCFVYEAVAGGSRNVLFAGDWYEIQENFAQEIDDFYQAIPTRPVIGPTTSQNEQELIKEITQDYKDLLMLDQTKINPDGVRYGNLEPCDFFSTAKQFIHLKDGHNSAPISHLWMQGIVSAESFARDKRFRNNLRKVVKKERPGMEAHLPKGSAKLNKADYEIVFGVMRKPYKDGSLGLPFFSRVSLRLAVRRLEEMGFKVGLNLIEKVQQ